MMANFSTFDQWSLLYLYMDVSLNGGTPKSSIFIGCSIINHPFWGTPIFGNTHMDFPFSWSIFSEHLGPTTHLVELFFSELDEVLAGGMTFGWLGCHRVL